MPKSSPQQKRLLGLFAELDPQNQSSLLAFAEFLASRQAAAPVPEPALGPLPPKAIPRPPGESVIAAIKRLSASYFMLEPGAMLNETSALMSAHVLQGRPAEDVIEELQEVFAGHYRKYLTTHVD